MAHRAKLMLLDLSQTDCGFAHATYPHIGRVREDFASEETNGRTLFTRRAQGVVVF